jgi:1,4-dihydroxy-2-naphthoate octaprenyltransferase
MTQPRDFLGPMRVPFLILAPACALLGLGTAVWTSGGVNAFHAVLTFLGAIAAHVSVNALNEYFDFKSGLDARTQPTPFSGGSGTLPAKPELAGHALRVGLIAMGITALIGLYFLFVQGLGLLPLGLLGLVVIFAYTPWLAHRAILCLLAPGLGFGTLMVMGVDYALTGEYSWTAFVASLVPFFLVNNLLLLNQFPDVEADRSIGRRNLPILIGKKSSAIVYAVFLSLTYLSILLGVLLELLPTAALLGLGTLLLAVPAVVDAWRYAEETPQLIRSMGLNVLINILTPALMGVGLLIA